MSDHKYNPDKMKWFKFKVVPKHFAIHNVHANNEKEARDILRQIYNKFVDVDMVLLE